MIEAVFISDLHLHPKREDIHSFFLLFIEWAKKNAIQKIYILGDFFHAWAGDDSLNDWSIDIARQWQEVAQLGTKLYYMHGNRDFLLGEHFARLAEWTLLKEPTLIYLDSNAVLLSHGDRYCTMDKAHQRFRWLTRNRIFAWLFLKLPLHYRLNLVNQIRKKSQLNRNKPKEIMDVTSHAVLREMEQYNALLLIHGHTHKPGITSYEHKGKYFSRYVLSDWDAIPWILCYDNTRGFYFNQEWVGV